MKVENVSIVDLQRKISALDRKLQRFGNVEMEIGQTLLEISRAKEVSNEAWAEAGRRKLNDLQGQRASLRGLSRERLRLLSQLGAQTDPKHPDFSGLQKANFETQEVKS